MNGMGEDGGQFFNHQTVWINERVILLNTNDDDVSSSDP